MRYFNPCFTDPFDSFGQYPTKGQHIYGLKREVSEIIIEVNEF